MTGPADVVVTGLGVVSPLGTSDQEIARRFAAGERAEPAEELGGRGALVTEIPFGALPEERRTRIGRLDRFCRLVLSASHTAYEAAGLDQDVHDRDRVGLSLGTGLGCLLTDAAYHRKIVEGGLRAASPRLFAYTVSSAAAGEVSIALGIEGPNVTSHQGFAAGTGALGYGRDLLAMGKADAVMAGGADACGAALVEALADMELLKPTRQARAYESRVPGVFPSEGAVVAVLARSDDAARDGRAGVLRFDGYAAGFEPTLTRAEHSTEGIVATIRRALEVAGRRPQEIGLVMTSAHGTPLDGVEIDAVAEALDGRDEALVLASKDALGEAFGAAGVLSLALVSGLWRARPKLADGVGRSLDGAPLVAGHANRRLDAAAVALNVSVCYSGTVVASIVSRID